MTPGLRSRGGLGDAPALGLEHPLEPALEAGRQRRLGPAQRGADLVADEDGLDGVVVLGGL